MKYIKVKKNDFKDDEFDKWADEPQDVDCVCGDHTVTISYNEYKEKLKDGEYISCPKCGYRNLGNEIELKKEEYGFFKKVADINNKKNTKPINPSITDDIGQFVNYLDMAKKFIAKHPLFYDRSCIWWIWDNDKHCYVMTDETDIMNDIDDALPYINTVKSKEKTEILESLKRVGRKSIPKDAPVRWVQFKDKAVSLRSGNIYDVDHKFFFTNPIPWEIGETSDTPNMDRIFGEWVGEKNINTLYEIIAYCCLSDYPISRIFCFVGSGSNGKTKFLNIIEKLVGDSNKCSTELDDLLGSKFEKAKLYRKLVCLMGETNFKMLEKTSLLKKLCGGDLIGFEFKNKTPFDARNYAKIIISTNSLPTTTDKTNGFYRRWMIIDFPNQFTEKKDILSEIPDSEYTNLCKKITEILPKLVSTRSFTNEGSYEERCAKYEEKSNPLSLFLKTKCKIGPTYEIPFFEFYDEYITFLEQRGFRKQSKVEVGKLIRSEGYDIEPKTHEGKTWKYIFGLEITQITQITRNQLYSPIGEQSQNTVIPVIPVISTIQSLKNKYNNKIPVMVLVDECGVTVDQLDASIEKCKKNGDIIEHPAGYIQLV